MNFEKKVTFIGFRKCVILQDFNKSNSVKAKLSISFWIFILHLIQLQHFSDILMHICFIYTTCKYLPRISFLLVLPEISTRMELLPRPEFRALLYRHANLHHYYVIVREHLRQGPPIVSAWLVLRQSRGRASVVGR